MAVRISNKRKVTPETAIKKAVKQYLGYTGWFHFPLLAGLGVYPGISDLIAIKDGRVLFIEIKTQSGTLSDNQIQFKRDVEAHGGEYLVVRSADQLVEMGL